MKISPANIFVYIFVGIILHLSTLNLSECRLCTKKANCDYSSADKKTRDLGQIVHRRKKDRCCACGTANYKLTFIGKWSKRSHPMDFPEFMTHWGPLIGCSHSNKYIVWEDGGMASSGFKRASEFSTAVNSLENEMLRQGSRVLDIVKATHIWSGEGSRTTLFRTDPNRPFLSAMSRMSPSPDWFVGVDRLSLCDKANCSWRSSVDLELRPWDAGTDDGITFVSVNTASDPQQPIHRITSQNPKNPAASFYNRNGKTMPPLAKLSVQLLGVSGTCDVEPKEPTPPPPRIHCKVSGWASWDGCSTRCGEGYQTRGRYVIQHPANEGIRCPKLRQRRKCKGMRCKGKRCKVSKWTQWSECSKTCGRGVRIRTRSIVRKPKTGGGKCPELSDSKKCRIRSFDGLCNVAVGALGNMQQMWRKTEENSHNYFNQNERGHKMSET